MTTKDSPQISWDRGDRIMSLQKIAESLAAGGMSKEDIDKTIAELARSVNPPPEQREAVEADRSMAAETRKYIESSSGKFRLSHIYDELGIDRKDKDKKNAVRVEVFRLKAAGVIESTEKEHSEYRRVNQELEPVDFVNATTEEVPVLWPFDLQDIIVTMPHSITCVAGSANVGKTAFLLNFVKMNMGQHEIHYFTNEMGAAVAKRRLQKFEDVKFEEWNMKMYMRAANFADVVFPNAINVFDYIENISGEDFKVKSYIAQIFNKLDKGIAVIAIQKTSGKDVGRGGEGTMERPHLYLSISHGVIKIMKAKEWRGEENPNGKMQTFKLVGGWKIVYDGLGWRFPEADEMAEKETKYAKVKKFKNIF